MGTLQDDQKDIEAMTVQELRTTLRQVYDVFFSLAAFLLLLLWTCKFLFFV